jgi:hypothetical protein
VFLFSPELRLEVSRRKDLVKSKKAEKPKSEDSSKEAPKTPETKPADSASKTTDAALELSEEPEESMTAEQLEESIDHLECLLDFIDKDFSSTKQKLDHLIGQGKISFRLLWTLFKPGSTCVSLHSTTEDKVGFKVSRAIYTKREEVDIFLSASRSLIQLRLIGWRVKLLGKWWSGTATRSIEIGSIAPSHSLRACANSTSFLSIPLLRS